MLPQFIMLRKLWPALAWAVVIIILMSLPGSMLPKARSPWNFLAFDKIIHAFIFFILSFLLMRGFFLQHKHQFLRSNHLLMAIVVGIVFGGLSELWQAVINTARSADIYDFIADSIGSVLAGPVFVRIKNKLT